MQDRLFDYLAKFLLVILPLSTFIGKAVIDINLTLIALTFLIKVILEKDYGVFNQKWFKVLLLFWGYLVLMSFFAKYPEIAFKRSIPWIRYPVFSLAISSWVLKDKVNIKLFFSALFATLAFIFFDSLVQIVTGTDLFGVSAKLTGEAGSALLITAFLKDHILGFHITFLIFPLIIYLLDQIFLPQISNRLKLLYGLFIGLSFVIVTFSGDRMAWLLMCFGAFLTLLFYKNYRHYILYMILLGVLGLSSIFALKPEVFNRQILMTYNDMSNFAESSYGRNFSNGLKVAMTSPVFGVGAKHYRHVLREDICGVSPADGLSSSEMRSVCAGYYIHPHNIYLEIFAEAGIIGLLIFLYFLYVLFKDLYKEREIVRESPILFGASLTFFLRFWPLAASASFYAAWTVSSGWLMLGLVYAMLRLKKDSNLKLW